MYLQDTSQKPYSSLVSPARVPLCLCFCISSNIFRVLLQWHSSCQASQTSVVYSPRLWPSASAYLIAFAILCCICTVLVGIQKESYGIIIYIGQLITCIYKVHYAPTCVEKELVSRHSRRHYANFVQCKTDTMRKLQHYFFCVQYAHSPKTFVRVSYLAPALPGNTWTEAASMCTCHYLIPAYNDINWQQRPCSSHGSLLHPRRTYLRSAWTRGGDYSHQWGKQKQQSHDCFISFDLIMVYHTHGISWPLNSHHIAIMPFPKHSSRCAEKSYTSIAEMPCKGRSIKSNVNQISLSWMFFNTEENMGVCWNMGGHLCK